MTDLSQLEAFVRVVDGGSFSLAARQSGVSKSTISKQISRLEARLGSRLLNRTTRRLSLTEVGARFYQRAVHIVADLTDAEQEASSRRSEPHGTLRINAPMSLGIGHLAPAIPAFMALYPDLKVALDLNDDLVDLIRDGYDLAIRIAHLPDSSLIARKLAAVRPVVCATPGYLRRHPPLQTPDDLKNHNCLIYAYLLKREEWHFRGSDGPMAVKISGNFRCNNGDTLRAVAVGGVGLYMGPDFIVEKELRSGRLRAVLQDFEETDLSIFVVYPHSRHLPAKVRAYVDFLVERFNPC